MRAARLLLDRAEAQQLTYELFSYEVDLLAAVDPMLRDPGKWAMNDHLCNLAAKLARSHGNTGSESSGLDAADR